MAYNASSKKIKPIKPPKIEVLNLKNEDVKHYTTKLINIFMKEFVNVLASSNFNFKKILLSEFIVLLKNYKVATSDDISSISSTISYTEDNILTSLDAISQLIQFRNDDYSELINSIKEGFNELRNNNSSEVLKDQFNELNNNNNAELQKYILNESDNTKLNKDITNENILDYQSINTLITSNSKNILNDISNLINNSTTTICNSIKTTTLLSTTFQKFDKTNLSKSNNILSKSIFKNAIENKNEAAKRISFSNNNYNKSSTPLNKNNIYKSIKSLKLKILHILKNTKKILEIIQVPHKSITKSFDKILSISNKNFNSTEKSLTSNAKALKNVYTNTKDNHKLLKFKDYINKDNINKYGITIKDKILPDIVETVKDASKKGSALSNIFGMLPGILGFVLKFIAGAIVSLISLITKIILGGITLVKWFIGFIIECLKNPVVQVFLAVAVAYIKVRYYEPIMKAIKHIKEWITFFVTPLKQELHSLLMFVRNVILIGLPKAKILLYAFIRRHFPILLQLWANTVVMIKHAVMAHILMPMAEWMAIELYDKRLKPVLKAILDVFNNHPFFRIVRAIVALAMQPLTGLAWSVGSFFNLGSWAGTAAVATYNYFTSNDSNKSWMQHYDKLAEHSPHRWVDNNILIPLAQKNADLWRGAVYGYDVDNMLADGKHLRNLAYLTRLNSENEYNRLLTENRKTLGEATEIYNKHLMMQQQIDNNPEYFRGMSDEEFRIFVDEGFDSNLSDINTVINSATETEIEAINNGLSTINNQSNDINEKLIDISNTISSVDINVKKLNSNSTPNTNTSITNNTTVITTGSYSETYNSGAQTHILPEGI
jgi:hypothetical protein